MEHKDFDDFSALVTNYFQHDYRERGIKKWQGYFLSDHTSALKRFNADNNFHETPMKQMATNDIVREAMHAMANWRFVVMQLNITTYEHDTPKNIVGLVANLNDRSLSIEHSDGKISSHLLEDIRAIRIEKTG
ncbi:hypothetical protein WZ78_03115 [Leuconostoc mesenteroides subsp. dextranicum]|uniref:hypothetical protein n=1 Tax=Leuconostoc mesenteroides TaxID=1245 RepID=UPI0006A201FA|nr:hypothetical protein [Leuconostoc mesenteroides]KMY82034.1 hypothetical protein WZ78_03115 [Leuconostoc mesenteroides subsp. dextranicum]